MAQRPANPWDRQPGESAPAWEAFRTYRDMGAARSTAKVAHTLGKSKTLMDRWSSDNAWVIRASAWDGEQDRLWQVELRAAQRKAAKKNVDLGSAIKTLAGHSLATMVQNQETLKPQDLARLVEVAARLEQQAFTTIAPAAAGGDSVVDVDLESLTDEEIRFHMLALRRELDAELGEYPDDLPDEEGEVYPEIDWDALESDDHDDEEP